MVVPPTGCDVAAVTASVLEQRVDQLLECIRPSAPTELRRLTIASYVCSLIKSCFPPHCQVDAFLFGSVPLHTYLPDGDIDVTLFSPVPDTVKDSWAEQLLAALVREGSRDGAPFPVHDCQIIQAEVKLVKCLVDGLVVDISFNATGGVCTVAFLEWVDRCVGRSHLFKRSIVLVKAWCFYEGRMLGAQHGMISSYALEAMVLYVFNLHGRGLTSPLQLLHRFLKVFSAFDWERHCLSMLGPIPLNSFPYPHLDRAAMPPGPPLLDAQLLRTAVQEFSVHPAASLAVFDALVASRSEMAVLNSSPPVAGSKVSVCGSRQRPAVHMQLKHLNITDPLLPPNNLGRSVNKTHFARIPKALAHAAAELESISQQEPVPAKEGIKRYFINTWESPARTAADTQRFQSRLAATGGMAYMPARGGPVQAGQRLKSNGASPVVAPKSGLQGGMRYAPVVMGSAGVVPAAMTAVVPLVVRPLPLIPPVQPIRTEPSFAAWQSFSQPATPVRSPRSSPRASVPASCPALPSFGVPPGAAAALLWEGSASAEPVPPAMSVSQPVYPDEAPLQARPSSAMAAIGVSSGTASSSASDIFMSDLHLLLANLALVRQSQPQEELPPPPPLPAQAHSPPLPAQPSSPAHEHEHEPQPTAPQPEQPPPAHPTPQREAAPAAPTPVPGATVDARGSSFGGRAPPSARPPLPAVHIEAEPGSYAAVTASWPIPSPTAATRPQSGGSSAAATAKHNLVTLGSPVRARRMLGSTSMPGSTRLAPPEGPAPAPGAGAELARPWGRGGTLSSPPPVPSVSLSAPGAARAAAPASPKPAGPAAPEPGSWSAVASRQPMAVHRQLNADTLSVQPGAATTSAASSAAGSAAACGGGASSCGSTPALGASPQRAAGAWAAGAPGRASKPAPVPVAARGPAEELFRVVADEFPSLA